LSKFASNGTPISPPSGYTGGGLNQTIWTISIDGSGDVWATGGGDPLCLTEFSSVGVALSPAGGFTGGGLFAGSTAVDRFGDVWIASVGALSEFSQTGTPISTSTGFTGGGLSDAIFLAVDGADNIWLTNQGSQVTEFSDTGAPISPATGYEGGGPFSTEGEGIAVDSSGNVWVANQDTFMLTELVGAAAPVVTPWATAVKNQKLGQRP
jgi:hypothetical protein